MISLTKSTSSTSMMNAEESNSDDKFKAADSQNCHNSSVKGPVIDSNKNLTPAATAAKKEYVDDEDSNKIRSPSASPKSSSTLSSQMRSVKAGSKDEDEMRRRKDSPTVKKESSNNEVDLMAQDMTKETLSHHSPSEDRSGSSSRHSSGEKGAGMILGEKNSVALNTIVASRGHSNSNASSSRLAPSVGARMNPPGNSLHTAVAAAAAAAAADSTVGTLRNLRSYPQIGKRKIST